MGDIYIIQINGGDFIASGGSKVVNHYAGQPSSATASTDGDTVKPTADSRFAYINIAACTNKEAQEAEDMLRQVAQKSPKEIANVVRLLQRMNRLRPIESKAGFVREFNNHFGARLNEASFYSAF